MDFCRLVRKKHLDAYFGRNYGERSFDASSFFELLQLEAKSMQLRQINQTYCCEAKNFRENIEIIYPHCKEIMIK